MRVKEIRFKEVITKDTYKAHLVEAIIRQLITDGKIARVTVEEMEVQNVEDSISKSGRVVSHQKSGRHI